MRMPKSRSWVVLSLLLALAALAWAKTNSNTNQRKVDVKWGKVENGLRVGLQKLPTADKDGLPQFRVHFENLGDIDRLLNLGVTIGTGHKPSAMHFRATDSKGHVYKMEMAFVVGGAMNTMEVPLPTGASYSLNCSLKEFWGVTRLEKGSPTDTAGGTAKGGVVTANANAGVVAKLPDGEYTITAQYDGNSVPRSSIAIAYWKGTLHSGELGRVCICPR